MYSQLVVLLIGVLVFVGSIRWVLPLWLQKQKKDITVFSYLSFSAVLISVLILFACFCEVIFMQTDFFSSIGLVFIAGLGTYLMYLFQKDSKKIFLVTLFSCFAGLFLLPQGVSSPYAGWIDIVFKSGVVSCWVLLVYLMRQFDRVPLFSFSSFSTKFLAFSLLITMFYSKLNTSLPLVCLMVLLLMLFFSFSLKKHGIFRLYCNSTNRLVISIKSTDSFFFNANAIDE